MERKATGQVTPMDMSEPGAMKEAVQITLGVMLELKEMPPKHFIERKLSHQTPQPKSGRT